MKVTAIVVLLLSLGEFCPVLGAEADATGCACSTSATRTPREGTGVREVPGRKVQPRGSADRNTFDPKSDFGADVVVLDWSQSDIQHPQVREPGGYESHLKSPLGERARWGKPTVLLGRRGTCSRHPGRLRGQRVNVPGTLRVRATRHPVFNSPIPIDRNQLIIKDWPNEWADPHSGKTIQVLPLILPDKHQRMPGWCTYTRDMTAVPEIEVFCGGINAKTATAAALWRQGNLLHYGFDLAPDEMNEWGKAILVNSITYIARFTDDRPIMETPSPFAGREFLTRDRIEVLIGRKDAGWWDHIEGYFDKRTLAAAGVKDLPSFANWYPGVRRFLTADENGTLSVDEDLRALDVDPANMDFLERCIADLAGSFEQVQRARRLLARRVPEGPSQGASADTWANWWKTHRDYLFYGEIGGYRWYLDPLAKKRGPDRQAPRRVPRWPLSSLWRCPVEILEKSV